MSDSDDEYDPSAVAVKKVVEVPPQQQQQQTSSSSANSNRVLGLRAGTSMVAPSSSSTANALQMFQTPIQNNNNNNNQSSSSSSNNKTSASASSHYKQLSTIKSFISKKKIFPITDAFSYRMQKQAGGGSIRCIAASNNNSNNGTSTTTILAGTTIGSTTASANMSCPLFAFDVREIARGAAVSQAKREQQQQQQQQEQSADNNNEFRQEGRYLFRADLFERERNGMKQQFPISHLTFLQTSSASVASSSSSSNIFAASAGGPTFKVGKVDKGGDCFAESPAGPIGSMNPELARGHCSNILSIGSSFNSSSSDKNKPEIVTAGADGTVRLWHLETLASSNAYCARHGSTSSSSTSMVSGRASRIIGGILNNNNNAIPSSSSSSSSSSSPISTNSSTILWSAGLDDGVVMFWDTRQKFQFGRSCMSVTTNRKICNAVEMPISSTSLFAMRTPDSVLVYDLRKSSSSPLLPEITHLPLVAATDASPILPFTDTTSSSSTSSSSSVISKNLVITADTADETEDNFRDGIAVINLSTGKVQHRAALFPEDEHTISPLSKKCPPPPVINGMVNMIGLTGHVGLACSDGVLRFAPVSSAATSKMTSRLSSFSGGAANNTGSSLSSNHNLIHGGGSGGEPWFSKIPMMSANDNNNNMMMSGTRRERE